ncbi:MAG TPA: hypothetical protein VMS86_04240 [Thermoanaerobaculia bacterium]|nr:hypothetical protein [Thermoanaerobaculia bacterium]
MLTGHNTEILHDEVAFHIQTEDKGRANPLIVSLIYVGGRVLAAKRTSYADLLAKGLGEHDVAELMDRQHRTMIAAIRHGRFDQHVRALLQLRAIGASVGPDSTDGDSALEDLGQSLDEMVSEFLGAEVPESLTLVLHPGAPPPRAGAESEIVVQALAMPGARAIGGAEVRVEMISPFEPPRLLASGRTDGSGRWRERLLVPDSAGGLAALIVGVRSSLGNAEEKILL